MSCLLAAVFVWDLVTVLYFKDFGDFLICANLSALILTKVYCIQSACTNRFNMASSGTYLTFHLLADDTLSGTKHTFSDTINDFIVASNHYASTVTTYTFLVTSATLSDKEKPVLNLNIFLVAVFLLWSCYPKPYYYIF